MVGLSGVGKIRLVQALFDNRLCPDQPALDPDNVIYADLSDAVTPQPSMIVEALVGSDADCVVVELITVEYDIRGGLPEGTVCYRLEGSSDEIIKELLIVDTISFLRRYRQDP